MSNIIYVNQEKLKRAEAIFALFSKAPKTPGDTELRDRHLELLKEADIDPKDKDTSVFAIYKNLGGAIRTEAEEIKLKQVKKKKTKESFARSEKDDEKVEDDDDDN